MTRVASPSQREMPQLSKGTPPLSAGVTLNSFRTKWSWVEPKTGVYCVCISQPSCLYIYNASNSLWKDQQQTLSKFDDSLKLESKLTFVLIKHPTAAVKQTQKKQTNDEKKLHAKQLYFFVSEGISYFFFNSASTIYRSSHKKQTNKHMIKALLPQLKFNGEAPLQVPPWLLPSSPLTSSCKLVHLIRKLGEGRAAEVEVEREGEYKLKDRKQERRLKKQHIWEREGRLQSCISSFFWSADIYHKLSSNCSCSSSLGWGSLMSLNIWRPTCSRSKDLLDTLRCGKWFELQV